MRGRREKALLFLVAALAMSFAPALRAQLPAPPPPPGDRIVANDGDVVIVEGDARVSIVRRREASVRVVYDVAGRWFLLLVDHAGNGVDGRVDAVYHYRDVGGDWPFETSWEGIATIEEYSRVTEGNGGLGIVTPRGLVQLLPSGERRDAKAAAVLTYRGGGSSRSMGDIGFDDAQRWYASELRRNDGVMRSPPGVAGSLSMSVSGGIGESVARNSTGAVRVGGNVAPPVKIVDVPAVRPEMAVRAGIRGIVILEVTIDVDGTVREARVLRSIPLLDAAAVEAVRQWRYELTSVDGKPVPVVMTVSVGF